MKTLKILFPVLVVLLFSCVSQTNINEQKINDIAESYVKLVLEIGQYDSDYVDAYWGPEEWKPEEIPAQSEKEFPADELKNEVNELVNKLGEIDQSKFDKMDMLRYAYLETQLLSVKAKIDLMSGVKMTFDEESKLLYDAVAQTKGNEYYENILKELDETLPGDGTIYERFNSFKDGFIIPKDKFDLVFRTAIEECRKRASRYIKFPENEGIEIEYVTDKTWSAYNWYKGDNKSLIQVNMDLPISIDWALFLAGHEVYLGHHTHFTLLESNLYKERNWPEFTVNPLFSPLNMIAEGLAMYGMEVGFPGEERIEFVKEILFPIAGLDQSQAEKYFNVLELLYKLEYKEAEIARKFLDGHITEKKAIESLKNECLMTQSTAERKIRFFNNYRSYKITYCTGKDMIRDYIVRNGGTIDNPIKRWELFAELLSTPQTPSELL